MAPLRIVLPILIAAAVLAGAGLASGQAPLTPEDADAEDGAENESPPEPATTMLRAREDDYVFSLLIEPGLPQKDRRVEMRLDLATVPENPHPTFGDRVPVRDASLIAVFRQPGEGGETRKQALHPLGGAGSYGLHWTPDREGMWRLSVERTGAELPTASFRVGVGMPTPAQDDASLGRGPGGPTRILGGLDRGQRGGGVVGPLTPTAAGPTASTVMSAISEPAGWLSSALDSPMNAEAAKEAVSTLREEMAGLPGTVPDSYDAGAEEYEQLAADLARRLAALAATIDSEENEKADEEWRAALDDTCARCHVKFWWGLSTDLSSWPSVSHQPWNR